MADLIPAPPIVPGYAYAIQIEVAGEGELFPVGCLLLAEIRRSVYAPLLARLTTENNGLARIDGSTIELRPDLDQVPALAAERDAQWKRIGEASFLTDAEKRAALGLPPLAEG